MISRRTRAVVLVAVVAALVIGGGGVYFGVSSESRHESVEAVQISEASTIVEETPQEATTGQSAPLTAQAPLPMPVPVRSSRIVIPRLNVDAPTVVLGLDPKGVMESPRGPMEVGWYNFSSKANGGGNIVMSGHADYRNYGPAVFARLRELQTGDVVQLLLADQSVATYRVSTISHYSANNAPVQQIVGKTSEETVTLITCEGTFDSRTSTYDKRLIVRAVRSG